MGFVLGLDIGYSNLKVAFGEVPAAGSANQPGPIARVLPAGAARVDDLPTRIGKAAGDDDALVVTIEGEKWVAGVSQSRIESPRQLHADFPSSREYKALLRAALLMTGRLRIDHLVTGLPVKQALDRASAAKLQEALVGEHQVTAKRTVTVEQVTVVPQPVGAFLDLVDTHDDHEALEDSRIMIIDPGYYSVDWVAIEHGEIRKASSGTSTSAMSVLIEAIDHALQQEYGGTAGAERIEHVIRSGKSSVRVYGDEVDLRPYIAAAAIKVAESALTEMKTTMRSNERAVDIVLIAGGGANTYRDATADVFPRSKIIVPHEPVLANARGFWTYANQ